MAASPALRAALALALLRTAFAASACSQSQWSTEGASFGDASSSSCDYLRDGECDVDLGYCFAGTDCVDCDPCSDVALSFGGCDACLAASSSCQWCPGSETCASEHGRSHISCSGGWMSSGCPAGTAISGFSSSFNDPAAVYQRWYLEAINVGPVWAQGITGAGVNIFFQDDGLDIAHADFRGKFDASVSVPSDPTPTEDGSYHGTACAGFAVASANNNVCGIGVAYDATVSASVMNQGADADELAFTIGVANGKHHVHSHSWGNDACPRTDDATPADNVHLQPLTGCPFVSDAAGSPCSQSECSVDWGAITIPDSCIQVISSYCSSNIGDDVGVYDPACADFWDLYVQCNHNSLSNRKAQWLREGVARGREGKGIVYVFAAGNEYDLGENVNFEGWLNSIYTITVGATARDGKHAWYSSAGAAVFVSAPGGESAGSAGHGRMVTTLAALGSGADDGCANQGQGTSYATPLAAGVVALMLQANPELGWRDVQDILARTSTKVDNTDSSWVTNGAGLSHSDKYGFGQIDAGAAVARATAWSHADSKAHALLARPVSAGLAIPQDAVGVTSRLEVTTQEAVNMASVEHVVVYITTAGHTRRGDLEVTLTSPAGTASLLVWNHHDANEDYERFKFMTVKSWGESAVGTWSLNVKDLQPNSASGNLGSWVLAIYGKCTVSSATVCRSILRETPPDKCEDTCRWASDGECDDEVYCPWGTDCSDCGPRSMRNRCEDTCRWASDGECDDEVYCPWGTDCSDCGPRSMRITFDAIAGRNFSLPTPAPTPSPPTPEPTPTPPVANSGHLKAVGWELVGAVLLAAALS